MFFIFSMTVLFADTILISVNNLYKALSAGVDIVTFVLTQPRFTGTVGYPKIFSIH